MTYTVTCESCGRLIATGFGSAIWEAPHGLCPTRAVTVAWTLTGTFSAACLVER